MLNKVADTHVLMRMIAVAFTLTITFSVHHVLAFRLCFLLFHLQCFFIRRNGHFRFPFFKAIFDLAPNFEFREPNIFGGDIEANFEADQKVVVKNVLRKLGIRVLSQGFYVLNISLF